jgi:hypothetical protein
MDQSGATGSVADQEDRKPEARATLWKRILASLRPSVSVETIKRTGKRAETVEVTGHIDFSFLIGCIAGAVIAIALAVSMSGCAEQPNAFSLDEGTIYHVGPFNFDSHGRPYGSQKTYNGQ